MAFNESCFTELSSKVAMDIEPGVAMLTGADVLHGPSLTILGAQAIAYLVMLIALGVWSHMQAQ